MEGRTQVILGSEDSRTAKGFLLGYARPERRFRWGPNEAQVVLEGYSLSTDRILFDGAPRSETSGLGVLVMARWRWRSGSHWPLYADVGWGLQYQKPRTVDLDGRLNSTPTLGVGFRIIDGREIGMVGLRFVHASNAGVVGANQGQNTFVVTAMFHL
jgi:hypothetical protein